MPSATRKFYSPLMFDFVFGLAGLTGLAGLVISGYHGGPAIPPAPNPLVKGAALVGVVVAGWLLAIQSTRLDQKLADDFVYEMLTKSAFIGMMGFIFIVVLWQVLLAHTLGGLTEYATIGILVDAWSLSYFYTRVRGTGA